MPQAKRDAARRQARELIGNLTAALEALDTFAMERDRDLERIERAWTAWRLGERPERAERLVFLGLLSQLAPRVQRGEITREGSAVALLSLPGPMYRLAERGDDAFLRARDLTMQLLDAFGRHTRHAPGAGPWAIARELIKEIWGVALGTSTLKVEFAKAASGAGDDPAAQTLDLIKRAPRLVRGRKRTTR